MKLCTDSKYARVHHRAAMAFARDFQPRGGSSGRPRALLTGFGRFRHHERNVSGLLMSELLPDLVYPEYRDVERGPAIGEQLAMALGTLALPTVGEVELCAMILPVYWDLAAVLLIRQLAAFEPQLVLMNGIATPRQPLWMEVEASNHARAEVDASGALQVSGGPGPIIDKAPNSTIPLRMSWSGVQQAAREAMREIGDEGRGLLDVMPDAILAPRDREGNNYVCNNTAYAVSYAMDEPGRRFRLLEASDEFGEEARGLEVGLDCDLRQVARGFFHWPSAIEDAYLPAASAVLKSAIDAQLAVR